MAAKMVVNNLNISHNSAIYKPIWLKFKQFNSIQYFIMQIKFHEGTVQKYRNAQKEPNAKSK